MDYSELSLKKHAEWKGKIEICSKAKITNKDELSVAYTPGVAKPCLVIAEDESKAYDLTIKNNMVAVVTDGTAVLGLGDIGPKAALPVMEGKCALFKEFGGVDAFPICLDTKDPDEIVKIVKAISPGFGGINLEDISAPRCFEIEERLKKELDIPVFHDDQHGTAIIVLAALINSLKLANKEFKDVTVVINGAGAAGIAICKLILEYGVKDVIMCDKDGIIEHNTVYDNQAHTEIAKVTNKSEKKGLLKDALNNSDIFVGVSRPNMVTPEMIKSMNDKPIIFAMANPTPEIMPDVAKEAGAFIVGTGRSDFPNQINNVLAFPGIFKGALKSRTNAITEKMKIAAAEGIANIIKDEITPEFILPNPFDERVADSVANAVINATK